MKRDTWRLLIILASILAGSYYLYPTVKLRLSPPSEALELELLQQKGINLGLDLQGGIHLVLEVDPSKLTADERSDVVERAKEIITNRVDQFGVSEPIIHREGDWRIVVELPGVQDIERAKKLIGERARLEFKILKSSLDRSAVLDRIDQHLSAAGDTARARLGGILGQPSGDGISLRKLILQDHDGADWLIAEKDVRAVQAILNASGSAVPTDGEFLWGSKPETMGDGQPYRRMFFVRRKVEMTGEIVKDARVTRGESFEYAGQPIINFTTTDEGVKIFSRVTGAHVDERMAIILDDQVYSAPTIQVKIRDGRSIITGSSTLEEAKDLAIVLRSGSLPAPIEIVEDRTVGPSLGRDSIASGKQAAIVGLIVVAVFMLGYYGLSGLVADLALALNLFFVLAILAAFGGTLTLPGIAGIILTIGMAVDANVLIYERIREELAAGRTLRSAVENGYARAFLTIVDANLTTIISGVVLYQFGTGAVKGFALTLMIGIISSMFTALFVTRTVFDLALDRLSIQRLSIGRLRIFAHTRVDFLKRRRLAYVASSLMVLAGLGSAVVRGGYNLGIDFAGGTLLELHFDTPVPVGDVREALGAVDVGGSLRDLRASEIKQFGSPNDILIRVEEESEGTATADAIKTALLAKYAGQVGQQADWIRRQEAVGPKIGDELKADAIKAIVVSMVLIIIYIWWRFKELKYGVAAVIALAHDVLITLAVFSVFDREVSLAIVAALLTIVGYSLNDTIVIFDRIREDLRLYRREGYGQIVNRSVNETLSRTVLTAGTTILVVLALLLLGGEVNFDFALALLVGVVAGTYSTVFIASPIVVDWRKDDREGAASAAQASQPQPA